ncbi:DUF5370 family protein [Heyndrickxia faecalis]|jgi:hypothetical protein|uniref:DUF5370 family protein n=1 Tax=Heyndrickxia TaxID=2837504 RepID=UPI003D19A632
MGAIKHNGYTFEPEFSVVSQTGAIHVYHGEKFIEEIRFEFNGDYQKAPFDHSLMTRFGPRLGANVNHSGRTRAPIGRGL